MKYVFIIVGVGGTGSLLARDLPKLLIGSINKMLIIDGDDVEEKNMIRQAYQQHDIGENKAIALAKKINSFHWNLCEAFDEYVTKEEIPYILDDRYFGYMPVIIGCVDNDSTRILIENIYLKLDNAIYIDSANSKYEGNVYVSYISDKTRYGKLRSDVYTLENVDHPIEKSCQELAKENTQFMITNLKMATAVLEHINVILSGNVKEGVSVVERFKTIHY